MQLSHNLIAHKRNLYYFEPFLLCIHMTICECKHFVPEMNFVSIATNGNSDICFYNEVGDKKILMI